MAAHRIGNTNPADQQCRKPHQCQKQRQPFDKPTQARIGIRYVTHAPPGILELRVKAVTKGLRRFRIIQIQSVIIIDQAAGLHQSGLGKGIHRHHQTRAEIEKADRLVGLGRDHAAHLNIDIAKANRIPDIDLQPFQKPGLGHTAPDTVLLGKGTVKRNTVGKFHLAKQRIDIINRLKLDQPALLRPIGGGAHGRKPAHPFGILRKPGLLFLAGGHMHKAKLDIPAQKGPAITLQRI